ncbi:MAG: hypothetical protein S4CHLAM123_07980 [Chlamydiales bacterium]|nr:hypothetical protein [Chlamydiales bacterium]
MSKISYFIFVLLLGNQSLSAGYHDRRAEGWAWYEDKKQEVPAKKENPASSNEEIQQIRQNLEEKLSKAILNPTDENVLVYMKEQMKWVEKSSDFASAWAHLLLSNPYLDQTVTGRPVSQYGLQFHKNQALEKRDQIIASLTKNHGLIFFYEGSNPVSMHVAEVVQEFSEKYGWEVLNVSVDEVVLEQLHNTKKDNGISKKMEIALFPALVVVDPRNDIVHPIAFGLVSIDKIEENIMLQFQEVME